MDVADITDMEGLGDTPVSTLFAEAPEGVSPAVANEAPGEHGTTGTASV